MSRARLYSENSSFNTIFIHFFPNPWLNAYSAKSITLYLLFFKVVLIFSIKSKVKLPRVKFCDGHNLILNIRKTIHAFTMIKTKQLKNCLKSD